MFQIIQNLMKVKQKLQYFIKLKNRTKILENFLRILKIYCKILSLIQNNEIKIIREF